MADFRHQIRQLKSDHTTDGLIDELAERTGERATSVNPLTESVFDEILPDKDPIRYARKSDDFSDDLSPVAKRATALKILLHEQVGRPLYEPVERPVKQDFAECIAAVDAHNEGYSRGMGAHVPTTLPEDIDAFVSHPPDREQTPTSPFEEILDLTTVRNDRIRDNVSAVIDTEESNYSVYVVDCTPDVGDESSKLWDRRRAVQTKIESGMEPSALEPKERATHALNHSKRVYYVGSTEKLPERIQQHRVGTAKSGVNFTNTLPPRRLVEVQDCPSKSRAESLEGKRARELNATQGMFAYSDEM